MSKKSEVMNGPLSSETRCTRREQGVRGRESRRSGQDSVVSRFWTVESWGRGSVPRGEMMCGCRRKGAEVEAESAPSSWETLGGG